MLGAQRAAMSLARPPNRKSFGDCAGGQIASKTADAPARAAPLSPLELKPQSKAEPAGSEPWKLARSWWWWWFGFSFGSDVCADSEHGYLPGSNVLMGGGGLSVRP